MKKLSLLIAILLSLPLVPGCSKKADAFDPQAFAADMLAGGAFSDELTEADAAIGRRLYGLEESDAEETLFYFSSGATAEEMAVFMAYDEEGAAKLADAAKARVERQKTAFESYVPAEVPKLDKAVVEVSGLYVVLYVAADYDAARRVADRYLGS